MSVWVQHQQPDSSTASPHPQAALFLQRHRALVLHHKPELESEPLGGWIDAAKIENLQLRSPMVFRSWVFMSRERLFVNFLAAEMRSVENRAE
ncbi:unnamed protein product [Diplocarpon coronariae]